MAEVASAFSGMAGAGVFSSEMGKPCLNCVATRHPLFTYNQLKRMRPRENGNPSGGLKNWGTVHLPPQMVLSVPHGFLGPSRTRIDAKCSHQGNIKL